MTAVAILKLEQMGKLSTDDPLKKFFPEAPAEKSSITVKQLLTHTSGMPDILGGDYQVVSRDEFVKRAMASKLVQPPGEKEDYSNSGYCLLAVIIEKASGRTYEQFVAEEVLHPSGAKRIGYVLPGWKKNELAVGYRAGDQRWGTPLDHDWADDGPSWFLRGCGGMLSRADELCQWYETLFDGKIIDEPALETYYAFDAGKSKSTGSRALGHAGGNGIFNSFQLSFIDADFHMTILTSTAEQKAEFIWRDFRQEVIELAKAARDH